MQTDDNTKNTTSPRNMSGDLKISSSIFRSRYLVNLLARSKMMMTSLEDGDNSALTYHLSRIATIAGEADLKEIQRDAKKTLGKISQSESKNSRLDSTTTFRREVEDLHWYIKSIRESTIHHRLK